MPFRRILRWFGRMFLGRKVLKIGLYGAPNVGKTSLANRISLDWTGHPVGVVSEIPHETLQVQKKERVVLRHEGKRLELDLLDMPGVSTREELESEHYNIFLKHEISEENADKRVEDAVAGVREAINYLKNVDVALLVVDSTRNPLDQVNSLLMKYFVSNGVPVIVVANKIDLRKAKPKKVKEVFSYLPVVEVSALKNENMELLYKTIAAYHR